MSRAAVVAITVLACGCITSYDELPLCAGVPGDVPTSACKTSEEVEAYQLRLVDEVLRWSQGEYPLGTQLRVHLNAQRRVDQACVGTEDSRPGWSTRDRVAASLPGLRRVEPGPECLAETTLNLTPMLLLNSYPTGSNIPRGLTACEARGARCVNQLREVCGFLRDGSRRDYENACEACRDGRVVGYREFSCEAG